MEKINIMFKIGDKIICIESTPSGSVIEGEVYTVKEIKITGVGIRVEESNPSWGFGWFQSKRFVKKDDWDIADKLLREVLEEELEIA